MQKELTKTLIFFRLKKNLWSQWYIQKYFRAVRAKHPQYYPRSDNIYDSDIAGMFRVRTGP